MATKETLERKRALESELEAIQAKLKETNGEFVRECLAEFFEKHPHVKAIRWAQYTPYFNDGEPCEFSSNHSSYPEARVVEGEADDEDGACEDDDDFEEAYLPYNYEKLSKEEKAEHAWKKELVSVLDQFTDSDMQAMFGDHAQVTITRDGIEVEEYNHD